MAVAAAVLALAAGLASSRAPEDAGASPSAGPSAATPVLAKRLLLRLHDLPLGYRLLNFSSPEQPFRFFGCTRLVPADPRPRLASFLRRYEPRGCMAVYLRLFEISGGGPAPFLVGSAAADLGSVKAAEAGLSVSRELIAHLTDDEMPEEVQPPETVGDATRLFRWRENGLLSQEEALTIVVWRWGSSVAVVITSDERAAAADSEALELARRQQRHLEAPTPYTAAELDDTEVALEDPALQVPVYWLGRTFAPGRGLPRFRLAESYSGAEGGFDDPRVGLLYSDRPSFDNADAVEMDLWTPRQWKKQRAKGSLPFELHCEKTRSLDLALGRAVVYTGMHPGWRCRQRGPKVYAAAIHLPGAVATVETRSICATCAGGVSDGPYNSFRGMATIARGLAPRLQPAS
ncbi:MAG TPA: hypothetical protein VD741_02880 [Solirubrobacterales bacterium]|nr:hypothetical protein [Solirubrobacterales bacterium]